MMETPHEVIRLVIYLDEGEAHQWSELEVEAACEVCGEELCELLLLDVGSEGTPVEREPGEGDVLTDDLDGFFEVLPDEEGAQHCVAVDHFLPCLLKHVGIEIPV